MSKGAWKDHAYTAKEFINGKWRYIYGSTKRLGKDAKVGAIRATNAARRGAANIIKGAKKLKYSANRPDYAVGRAFRKAGKGIKNAKTYAKAAAGNIRVAGQKKGIFKKAPDYSWHRKHQLGVDRVNKSNWIHYAGSSENTRGMNKTGEGIRAGRNKIAAKGKAYYNANNAAIAANKKGKSQTEYYKNMAKKQAAMKAAKRQADLDRMTSTSRASINATAANRKGKSQTEYYKTASKRFNEALDRRRKKNMTSDEYKAYHEVQRNWGNGINAGNADKKMDELVKQYESRRNAKNSMTSGGSASDREALRRAAEQKERARKEQERLKRNAINRAAKKARKNIEASKAAKKQADIDRMTSSTSPKEKWRDLINAGSKQNKTNLLDLANGKKKKNRRR